MESAAILVPAFLTPSRSLHGFVSFRDGLSTVEKIDVTFPVLYGKNGEDGTLQGLLNMAGIPYVVCGVLSSALCMDKDAAHRLVQLAGIPVPHSVSLTRELPEAELLQAVESVLQTSSYMVDLKRFDSRRVLRALVVSGSRVPPARDSLPLLLRISVKLSKKKRST